MDELLPPIVAMRLLRFAEPGYRFERCGIVDAKRNVIELPNRSTTPGDGFKMATADVRSALRTMRLLTPDDYPAKALSLIWHTHTEDGEADPSEADVREVGKLTGVIIHVPTRTLTVYDRTGVLYRTQG